MLQTSAGNSATDRAQVTVSNNTVLCLNNSFGAYGVIDQWDIYVASQISADNCKVGIFRLSSGSNYTCVASYTITSTLAAGLRTGTMALQCRKGDFAGVWHSGGTIDRADTGGTSAYYTGDAMTVGSTYTFTTASQARLVSCLLSAQSHFGTATVSSFSTTPAESANYIEGKLYTGNLYAKINGVSL